MLYRCCKSISKNICYSDTFAFTSKQTTYGCKHESQAKEKYFKSTIKDHSKLEVIDSGLVLNPKWPHIGASPDGIVWCECCGRGALEIKCPYCHQGESIDKAATHDKKFCLKKIDGSLSLDKTHAYYYQVQTQMFVCDVSYCEFCAAHLHVMIQSQVSTLSTFIKTPVFGKTAYQKQNIF